MAYNLMERTHKLFCIVQSEVFVHWPYDHSMSFSKPFRHDLDLQEFCFKALGFTGGENIGFK